MICEFFLVWNDMWILSKRKLKRCFTFWVAIERYHSPVCNCRLTFGKIEQQGIWMNVEPSTMKRTKCVCMLWIRRIQSPLPVNWKMRMYAFEYCSGLSLIGLTSLLERPIGPYDHQVKQHDLRAFETRGALTLRRHAKTWSQGMTAVSVTTAASFHPTIMRTKARTNTQGAGKSSFSTIAIQIDMLSLEREDYGLKYK